MSRIYTTWHGMIQRCANKNATGYDTYGGAGVNVCDRWLIFENFYIDMGARPAGTTLGRILDRGNYEPGNCFWMTKAEQNLTRRNNNALQKWELLTQAHQVELAA